MGFVFASLTLLAMLFKHRLFFHDDAFISLRYARNLAEHGQVTWNIGEYSEGYTNFLYVLMTAIPIKFGADPALTAQMINIAAVLLLLLIQLRAAKMLLPDDSFALTRAAALVITAATPALSIWVLGGLESIVVAMFAAAGLLALLPATRSQPNTRMLLLAAVAFSLAVLTRLDIAVFVVGAGVGLVLAMPSTFRKRLFTVTVVVGIPAAVSLIHMGWRFWYYGELLPLTFYAKADIAVAVRTAFLPVFAAEALPSIIIVVLAAVASVFVLVTRRTTPPFWLLFTPFFVQLLYVAWSGGDHMPGARVLVPLVVPAALLFLTTLQHQSTKTASAVAAFATAVIVLPALTATPLKMDPAAFDGRIAGVHINQNWPADSTVALHTAGSTPYFATNMTFIDMLGLNDPIIAKRRDVPMLANMQRLPGHAKGDGQYVLDRQPDYIIAGPAPGNTVYAPWFLSDVELSQSAEFSRCYALRNEKIVAGKTPPWHGSAQTQQFSFTYYQRICD